MKITIFIFLILFASPVLADDLIGAYPQDCITPKDKIEFCYIAQETLRLDHNEKALQLSKEDFKNYKEVEFRPKQRAIINSMLEQKEKLKKSKKWRIDLQSL